MPRAYATQDLATGEEFTVKVTMKGGIAAGSRISRILSVHYGHEGVVTLSQGNHITMALTPHPEDWVTQQNEEFALSAPRFFAKWVARVRAIGTPGNTETLNLTEHFYYWPVGLLVAGDIGFFYHNATGSTQRAWVEIIYQIEDATAILIDRLREDSAAFSI